MFDSVNGVDGFQHVLDGAVNRVLAGLQGQALVPHILEGHHLTANLLLGQLFSGYVFVLGVVGTVNAAVDAVVGQIQGREHHDSVAVEILLDLLGQGVYLLVFLLQIAVQQHDGFLVRQPLSQLRFRQDFVDQSRVVLVGLPVGQCFHDFTVVDKVVRMG